MRHRVLLSYAHTVHVYTLALCVDGYVISYLVRESKAYYWPWKIVHFLFSKKIDLICLCCLSDKNVVKGACIFIFSSKQFSRSRANIRVTSVWHLCYLTIREFPVVSLRHWRVTLGLSQQPLIWLVSGNSLLMLVAGPNAICFRSTACTVTVHCLYVSQNIAKSLVELLTCIP